MISVYKTNQLTPYNQKMEGGTKMHNAGDVEP